jgi:exonuclease III
MPDVELDMLKSIYAQLMVDDRRAVRPERGFTWWRYRLLSLSR